MSKPKYGKLKGYFVENGIRMSEVAELIGVDPASISQKLSGTMEWTFSQVTTICNHYGISADKYFFNLEVTKTKPEDAA